MPRQYVICRRKSLNLINIVARGLVEDKGGEVRGNKYGKRIKTKTYVALHS